ncbi:hypothetical protein PAPYR_4689 [Paratrimastix pyriformis]|uniref:Uncharacterized protein n=1 Tax=Paratrimastix pyriformis TaxID=342808 RepID=A0ABQ8UJI1_9EUKA|nr:hypothetical protein PAPYR_4689 [Paratrimastix pyriformis]
MPFARAFGALRELSFPENIITTDALAALVGPCKSLVKLTLPKDWDRPRGAKSNGWVDATFGGHTQLTVLTNLPFSLPDPAVVRILSHLPGLVELTAGYHPLSARVLAALARSCPRLQVLRSIFASRDEVLHPNISTLAPLFGVLKELVIGEYPGSKKHLAAFVSRLSVVTSLKLYSCPPAALEPIASHLTALKLDCVDLGPKDLPGPWLCHLETLSLSQFRCPCPPLFRLVAANQPTLRRLGLKLSAPRPAQVEALADSLRAMPHLTRLRLDVFEAHCSLSALLPHVLVDRLENLRAWFETTDPHPLGIASSRLQKLRLSGVGPTSRLDCPALVELNLAVMAPDTSLQCPRLRVLRVPAALRLAGAAHMPDLEEVASREPWEDPVWLLTGLSPRPRVLSGVRLTRPDLLASLCTCQSLVRLRGLHLDVTRLPNPLVLRLPGQLEHLDLHLERAGRPAEGPPPPVDLRVEAPGLVDFALAIPDESNLPAVRLRLHNCPRLVSLQFQSPADALLSLRVDEDEAETPVMMMLPRSLRVVGAIDAAGLLGLLARHGSRLREVELEEFRWAGEAWPQLLGALSGLPRLISLTMDVTGASSSSPLMLACPQLRKLELNELPDEAKVMLSCPMLEQLGGIGDQSRQVVLDLPAPNLQIRDEEG